MFCILPCCAYENSKQEFERTERTHTEKTVVKKLDCKGKKNEP